MSRLYFHSPSGTAEILGSERAWLSHVASGPGAYAWDLDRVGASCDRAYALIEMSPEPAAGEYAANYLHTYAREAKAADERYHSAARAFESAGRPGGMSLYPRFDPEPGRRFIDALKVSLRVRGLPLRVAGHDLTTANLESNTALVAGSDVVALAAKLDGWNEQHCWVEGPDRAWMGGLVEQGLESGILRRGLWYSDTPDGPKDQWSSQGWEELVPWLRGRDDEPVVLSYSVGDRFPNQGIADWSPPELPDGWAPAWADDDRAEWDALSDDGKQECRDEYRQDSWYEVPDAEQWAAGMRGLRTRRPWARLSAETLREVSFGPMVTVYDLFAPDRDERVRRAFGESEPIRQVSGV